MTEDSYRQPKLGPRSSDFGQKRVWAVMRPMSSVLPIGRSSSILR